MLIKLLIFIVAFVWIFRGISRYVLGKFIRQAQQQQQQFHQQRQGQQSTRRTDGNVNVEMTQKKKNKKSTENFKGGEYVDYEELD